MLGCTIDRTAPDPSTPNQEVTLTASIHEGVYAITCPIQLQTQDNCQQVRWIALGFLGSRVQAGGLDIETEFSKRENRRVVRFVQLSRTQSELLVARVPVKDSEGTQYLYAWQISQDLNNNPDFSTISEPMFLGSNNVIFERDTAVRFFGNVTKPQIPSPPDPINRVILKPFAPLPTAGYIANLEYQTGIGISTIFLTILRGNDRVPDSPFNGAVKYLTQGIFKQQVGNVITWAADSVADGKQEPTNAVDPDNKLVVWEQSRGAMGTVYSPHIFPFFARISAQ
jgi:hypothetical protein